MTKNSLWLSFALDAVFCMSFMLVTCPEAHGAPKTNLSATYLKQVALIDDLPTKKIGFESPAMGIKVRYERACGETFRGILVNEQENVVQVGVAVERSPAQCSSLPTQEILVLPIATTRAIDVFPGTGSTRLTLVEATDVSMANGHIFVTWQDSCRPIRGVLISPVSSNGGMTMGINLAQSPSDRPTPAVSPACRFDTQRLELTSVHIPKQTVQLVSRPGELKSLYVLGLKAPRALTIAADGALSVAWDKTCQEKAIGALFSGVDGKDVAIVSIFSPNAICRSLQMTTEIYTIKALSVPRDLKLMAMTKESIAATGQEAKFKFNLLPISSLNITRLGAPQSINATVLPTCSNNLGLVVGEDSIGNVAMAVLAAGRDKTCHVQESSTALSLQAPIVGPASGPMPKVFGLKIFGTMIN